MDPGNAEYRQALTYMSNRGAQPYRGMGSQGDELCDVCGKLVLADCCCEMMGGDLIRCC